MRRRPLRARLCLLAWGLAVCALLTVAAPVVVAAARHPHARAHGHARARPKLHRGRSVRTLTGPGHTIYQSRHLWATINVCDNRAHPRMVGVRASMPGSGLRREHMFMRIALQYQTTAGGWRDVGHSADSGFMAVGSSSFKARQAGRNFHVMEWPGMRYVLRGVVTYEWRRRGHVVRHARKSTTAGHLAVAGSRPPGYSAAACLLT